MKILNEIEVNTDTTINRTIKSGQLGVIVNEDKHYELVYFTHCHYESSSGRISNTFEYCSFGNDSVLEPKRKNYFYSNIYGLKEEFKGKYGTVIVLVED